MDRQQDKDNKKITQCNSIRIQLASPEKIRQWSFGEVTKPETINYRTFKPERDGLFCERIFGPVKDWECNCGKYKRIRYRGVICDRCGVEVTQAKVRRDRLGHIELAVPVCHIWYFKSPPTRIGNLLNMSIRNLERVIYYESYVVLDPGDTELKTGELLDQDTAFELEDAGHEFVADMGAAALRKLLSEIDVDELSAELRAQVKVEMSIQRKNDALKRLKVVEAFRNSGNRPEWMILEVLPVIPPDLRPLVPLEGGRFATSDLNDLYRRVINRNNRLKKLIEIKAPDVILRNEKRMLQEAVDALLDNGRRSRAVRGDGNRSLKSLSDLLKGKQGRFRQNLLGKRVDYSGRSVIVVGPELQLHECGLPKNMALELFKPHMINELMARGYTQTPRSAKLMIEDKDPIVYKVLEYVVKDHPVMLNRAPTLHRLGIQAFQPVLVDGKALRIHPLVCSAFNADFDGDQMAVHVPLSLAAQMECRILMLSSHNILHPANGKPLALPSQDMVLGTYYLTCMRKDSKGEGKSFGSFDEVILAYENKSVDVNATINVRHNGDWYKETTVGRVIINAILPEEMDYIDDVIDKKRLSKLVNETYLIAGNQKTVEFLDKLKNLGFEASTRAGLSIAVSDILIPDSKDEIINIAQKEVDAIQDKFKRHVLTDGERYNKVIDIWTHATNSVAASMMDGLKSNDQGFNPVYMMADSGARGSQDQIKQLAGMRGLMAKPKKSMTGGKGEIIESPITSNFKEGLSVQEYFISTHGARKGLADTALKTADAGYLTRRLVDVSQDVVISETDCGTINGILADDLKEGEDIIEPLSERVLGRTVLEDFIEDGKTKIKSGTMIRDDEAIIVADSNIESLRIRSVLTCESLRGVCAKCYGWNPSNHKLVDLGTAVGIQAAQSIGEPGTQLTLRTFHIGGTATRIIEQSEMKTKRAGKVKYSENLEVAEAKDEAGILVTRCMVRHAKLAVHNNEGKTAAEYNVPYGANLNVGDGDKVDAGASLFQWDPYTDVILARQTGIVELKDFIENETYQVESVEGGKKQMVIVESKDRNLSPHVEIVDKDGAIIAGGTILPVTANLVVRKGDKVKRGQTLVKIPRAIGKTRDITGGLPRVTELFEARKPTDPAVVSEIDGHVKFGETKRGIRKIIVTGVDSVAKTYSIPYGKHVVVHEGDKITAGTSLCEGSISPADILKILGPNKVREYLVNEIQEVYRLQGVKIDDKHIEVIVRQMMQKVSIDDVGDSHFLPQDRINRAEFFETNEKLASMVVITNSGDSELEVDTLVSKNDYTEINKTLKEEGKKPAKSTKARPATFNPLLMGITQASLNTESFISAASFQETTRVLTDASTSGKTDYLRGLKENVAVGRLIPAGSGSPHLKNIFIPDPENKKQDDTEIDESKVSKELI